MFLSKKSKRLPHIFTVNLFVAQVSTWSPSIFVLLAVNYTKILILVMYRSLVANLYRDDPVELCGEGEQLHWAGPDFHIIMHFTLQYLRVARFV